ncbi:glycosyltransferase 87 family protein [Roseiflexus sp.]|uniref:glycosyltransferase 87 family protein n=1 Tax=Roseiflexus sp. TaxID=2562120 RepID=UPI00398BA89E
MNDEPRCSWFYLAGIVLTALLIAGGATALALPPVCDVGAGEDVGCARGFETRERDGYGSFRWTDGDAGVVLSAAGYGAPHLVEIVMAAPRPPDVSPPSTTLSVAATSIMITPPAAPRRYRLLHPPDFPAGETIRIAIQSETWKPDGDRRNLGVLVYLVRVRLLGDPVLPPLQHTLAILAIGLAASFAGRHPLIRTSIALGAIGVCGVLWVWFPMRTTPFLPFYALLLGSATILFAWLKRREPARQPVWFGEPVVLAAIGGVLLDALIVTGVTRGSWVVPVIGAQATLAVWGVWRADRRSWSLPDLLRIALIVRLLALTTRLLSGEIGSDPDVELFYNYGRATLELGLPVVEYPSGALIPWALMALPASRELFALALPLCNTAADLLIVWGIWQIGFQRRAVTGEGTGAAALACFYALSSLLLPFWHGKYDSLPTALLALGLVAFAHRRMGWSGVALGIGGALKWTPWLAAPVLAFGIARLRSSRSFTSLWAFAAGGMIAVAVTSIPFALIDWERFLAPYTLQGGRAITGESLWFLVFLVIAPEHWSRLPAPWGAFETGRGFVGVAVAVQGATLAGLMLNALRPALSEWRLIALAALTPAIFLLLNRVFSPQYILTITAAALIASAAVGDSPRVVRNLVLLLTITQAANLLVWPNTVPWWPLASAVMFITAASALGWIVAGATRQSTAHFHRHGKGADL